MRETGPLKSRSESHTYKVVLSAMLVALGATFSVFPGAVPIGPTKVFPFQHMINVVAGILLGPVYAALVAALIGVIRIGIGTGTLFALSGGVPGAIVVGLAYKCFFRREAAGLTEPVGTALGALISAFFVAPFIGAPALPQFLAFTAQWELFTIFFLMSSIPGAVLGYLVVLALKRRGVLGRD
ncbi:MAG: energy coupling factor transporter S component ThiW [Candidatus Verstraetearchaeota archaeon]|nr:energy coupling factor transporter S component ThiW [Candidatus Verstraetearchaeota archaeon]